MPKIEPPVEEIPQTVNINGVEYSPEDAQSFIELGKKTKDLETRWNTPIDNVWPEYGKTREELKTIQAERDQYKTKLAEFEAKQNAGVETQADLKEVQEAARKAGIILNDDLDKRGYVKKEELETWFNERTRMQEETNKILEVGKQLEKEIDGSDGRPAYNNKVVLAYASAYGIPDLKSAYEDMNKGALDKWKEAQVNSQRNKGLKTFNSSGGKREPTQAKVTDDNVSDLLKEQLYGEE